MQRTGKWRVQILSAFACIAFLILLRQVLSTSLWTISHPCQLNLLQALNAELALDNSSRQRATSNQVVRTKTNQG